MIELYLEIQFIYKDSWEILNYKHLKVTKKQQQKKKNQQKTKKQTLLLFESPITSWKPILQVGFKAISCRRLKLRLLVPIRDHRF